MFEKVLLKNSSQYNKKKQFKISNYKPFFVNEVKGYKLSRLPKFKDKYFSQALILGPGKSLRKIKFKRRFSCNILWEFLKISTGQ